MYIVIKIIVSVNCAYNEQVIKEVNNVYEKICGNYIIYSVLLFVSLYVIVEVNMNNRNSKIELFLVIFFITSILIELLIFYFVIKTGESYEQQQRTKLIAMKRYSSKIFG